MKWNIQHVLAATLLAAAGTPQAATVTAQAWDLYISGTATLSFSADLQWALDTGKVSVASYGYAAPAIVHQDTDGFYTAVSVTAPISTLTYDNVSTTLLGIGTVGGVTLTAPVLRSVSSGGQLTVTDLNADLSTQTIYADIIGANGVGTLSHLALWHVARITGSTKFYGAYGGLAVTTFSGLSLTSEGLNAFTQSLGLLTLGKSVLMGVTDFGTLTAYVNTEPPLLSHPPLTPPWYVSPTPEPSTYALMGLGLIGLVAARRRHAA